MSVTLVYVLGAAQPANWLTLLLHLTSIVISPLAATLLMSPVKKTLLPKHMMMMIVVIHSLFLSLVDCMSRQCKYTARSIWLFFPKEIARKERETTTQCCLHSFPINTICQ